MLTRVFGGREVPIIGQGTWKLRGPEAVATLREGLALGLTHVDTAEMYGTEELVAEAIAGQRDDVFLVSKVLPSNASREGTIRACEDSLRRLKTDRLDCYLLHWPGEHPLDETLAAFEELREAGKVKSYGLSNFDAEGLREAVRIAGPGRIACDQVLYNLEERHVEAALWPVCQELGVALVGYTPLAGADESRAAQAIARELDATPRQVALAFLTRLDGTFVIPKASRLAHVRENARSLRLNAAQLARLDQAHPVRVRRDLPML